MNSFIGNVYQRRFIIGFIGLLAASAWVLTAARGIHAGGDNKEIEQGLKRSLFCKDVINAGGKVIVAANREKVSGPFFSAVANQ
jgi:hypothetical protein